MMMGCLSDRWVLSFWHCESNRAYRSVLLCPVRLTLNQLESGRFELGGDIGGLFLWHHWQHKDSREEF